MATPVLENVRSEELRKEVSGAAKARTAGLVLAASVASFLIHGYHPYSEDAAIYVQAVKQFLDPSLYRQSDSFFHPHVHLSIFPWLVAMSIRLSHLPFEIGMLAWQLFTIALLLEACRRLCHV